MSRIIGENQVDLYRARLVNRDKDGGSPYVTCYGPYTTHAQAKVARARESYESYSLWETIEAKVQKLTCAHDGNGPDLQWVDVDG